MVGSSTRSCACLGKMRAVGLATGWPEAGELSDDSDYLAGKITEEKRKLERR